MHTAKNNHPQKGFTIFFAVLIIALLLAVATSISLIASKQLQLLTLGNQSELAFYAADSGAECALYWDKNITPDPFDPTASPQSSAVIVCDNQSITANVVPDAPSPEWSFDMLTGSIGSQQCAAVTVTKTDESGVWITDVNSRGYDGLCTGSELERALHFRY